MATIEELQTKKTELLQRICEIEDKIQFKILKDKLGAGAELI